MECSSATSRFGRSASLVSDLSEQGEYQFIGNMQSNEPQDLESDGVCETQPVLNPLTIKNSFEILKKSNSEDAEYPTIYFGVEYSISEMKLLSEKEDSDYGRYVRSGDSVGIDLLDGLDSCSLSLNQIHKNIEICKNMMKRIKTNKYKENVDQDANKHKYLLVKDKLNQLDTQLNEKIVQEIQEIKAIFKQNVNDLLYNKRVNGKNIKILKSFNELIKLGKKLQADINEVLFCKEKITHQKLVKLMNDILNNSIHVHFEREYSGIYKEKIDKKEMLIVKPSLRYFVEHEKNLITSINKPMKNYFMKQTCFPNVVVKEKDGQLFFDCEIKRSKYFDLVINK